MSGADTPERAARQAELARLEEERRTLEAALARARSGGASLQAVALRRAGLDVRRREVRLRRLLGLPTPADALSDPELTYGRLGAYLAARPADEARVALTFARMEALLGCPLPAAARRKRRAHWVWWRGDAAYPHAWHGWLQAGWRVEAVDLTAETVTFARSGAG